MVCVVLRKRACKDFLSAIKCLCASDQNKQAHVSSHDRLDDTINNV